MRKIISESDIDGENKLSNASPKRIILSPDNKTFKDIILENVPENDFKVVAEFVTVIASSTSSF